MKSLPVFIALAIAGVPLPFSARAQTTSIVRVEMNEFAFRPATISVSTGQSVRLVLVNRGQIAHQFETSYLQAAVVRIVGETMALEVPGLHFFRLAPGGTARLEFFPREKGRFIFMCTIEGHREAGMQGVLEVR
jgi:uncharacterized cupredoxin-like copper-binding protein